MINLLNFQPKNVLAVTYPDLTGSGIQPDSTGKVSAATQLEDILSLVLGFLTVVAVIYFVIQIILAGYAFISGQGDEKKIEMARKKLTDGILGLTIVVIAFGITAFLAHLLGLQNSDGSSIFDLDSFIKSVKP